MTEAELKNLAIDIYEGRVFGTFNMERMDMLPIVFMPLFFMNNEQSEEIKKGDIAQIYEYIDKAGPRSCNGLPMFMSLRTISNENWKKVVGYIEEYEKLKKGFMEPEE